MSDKSAKVIFRKPDEQRGEPDPFAEEKAYIAYHMEKQRLEYENQRRGTGRFKYRHSNRLVSRRGGRYE